MINFVTSIKRVDCSKIVKFIQKIDNLFPVPISKKININEYVTKLYENGTIILAKDNEKIVGIMSGYMNDMRNKKAYASIIGVDEEYQNQKIGIKLFKIFHILAKKNGIKKIYLSVHKENKKAIDIYKKYGYKIIDKNISGNNYDYTLEKEIENNTNILITSVGRRGYLVKYFKDVIGDNGKVFVSNSSDITPAFNYADYGIVTPLIYDKKYIDFILDFCIMNEIDAVISLFDIDLPILSKNKELFEKLGIKIIVSDYKILEICNDKYETYKFLKEHNFNVKKTYINLDKAIDDINKGIIHYPLIIKPRWGMGSISIYEVDNEDELRVLYKKAMNNINNSYLKYESETNINESVLIQEKIIGQEYGLDIINDLDKKYVNTIVREKVAMRSGETDCAIVIKDKRLEDIGKRISKAMRHIANMDVDIIIENNNIYVLEMNARFGGGYPFSHISGVNLPLAIIKWINNEKVDKEIFVPKKYNEYIHKDINIVKLKKDN